MAWCSRIHRVGCNARGLAIAFIFFARKQNMVDGTGRELKTF
jgi:hypothetical protein